MSNEDVDRDVIGYGEETNNRFYRERANSLNLVSTCTPPQSGTYDVVVYGHTVAGDNARDFTSLKIRNAAYNILG